MEKEKKYKDVIKPYYDMFNFTDTDIEPIYYYDSLRYAVIGALRCLEEYEDECVFLGIFSSTTHEKIIRTTEELKEYRI